MAIGAGHVIQAMDACFIHFITRMLGFQHRSLADFMGPVLETSVVIVFFHGFSAESIIPWKCYNTCGLLLTILISPLGLFKVVLGMTLGTDQGAQILMRSIFRFQAALSIQAPFEKIARDRESHGLIIMTISAANWVCDLAAMPGPFAGEIIQLADLINQPGHIR